MNLDLVTLPVVRRRNVGGKRLYCRGDTLVGYPSVTTIVSTEKTGQKALHEWRRRVGFQEANRISRQSANRGTGAHKLIEDYIHGREVTPTNPFYYDLFSRLRDVADQRIGRILTIEGMMVSDHLRVGGTVDMIAEFDGRLAVVDWKTSIKRKSHDRVQNYFLQEAAYAVMFEESTKIPVDRLVTIISTEDGFSQVFVERRDDWINKFVDLRTEYDNV